MSERLKEHDWKSCVRAKTRTEGSNPSLSASKTNTNPCASHRGVQGFYFRVRIIISGLMIVISTPLFLDSVRFFLIAIVAQMMTNWMKKI